VTEAATAAGPTLEAWIGGILTLMVLSFLYRDNPFYKIAEHILVGVSAAYIMVLGFWSTLWPNGIVKLSPAAARLVDPNAPTGQADLAVLIPMVLGLLMLCRLSTRWAWLSRWPAAFAIGTTAGYNLTRYLRTDFLNQLSASAQESLVVKEGGRWLVGASLDNILILTGTVCGLIYFTYSREHRGAFGRAARVGVWFLMVTFGAAFGYTVMARFALLIGRFHAVLGDWWGLL
jgi:hypothetical protein